MTTFTPIEFIAASNLALLDNNRIYVGSASSNESIIISRFEIKDNGNLTLLDNFDTKIPGGTYNGGQQLLGQNTQLFLLATGDSLYSFDLDPISGRPTIKDKKTTSFSEQSTLLISIQYIVGIELVQELQGGIGWSCKVNASGHFQDMEPIELSVQDEELYVLGEKILSEALLLYFYDIGDASRASTGAGRFHSYDLKSLQAKPDTIKSSNLKIIDFIPDKSNTRLFYASVPNQFHKHNQLGVFSLEKGKVDQMLNAMEVVTDNFIKLVLHPNGCHILAATENLDGSGNGSLVLYRINNPAIGCPAESASQTPLNLSISASVIFLSVTVLVTGAIFYCLKKQGAKKGYMPIGGD